MNEKHSNTVIKTRKFDKCVHRSSVIPTEKMVGRKRRKNNIPFSFISTTVYDPPYADISEKPDDQEKNL